VRDDGQPAPSDATWHELPIDDLAGIVDGDTLTGATSGATGVVVAIAADLLSVAVTKVTGTFVDTETVNGGATTLTGDPISEGSLDITTEQAWRLLAETEYRDDILVVPGLNAIRGVWQIKDRVYAFRDNAGETACIVYKATAAGWNMATMTEYIYLFHHQGYGFFLCG